MRKKRILMSTEASYALSGFGKYTREILKRLYDTHKFEIAEHASYGHVNDNKDRVPWIVYPNAVAPNDPRHQQYKSKPTHQFGEWRFDRVCLDFKPDIVFNIRDPWMIFEENSPYRRFFHLSIMPTFDSAPSNVEWLQKFIDADSAMVYSEWAIDILKKETGGRMDIISAAPPGVDLDIFKPTPNQQQSRQLLGLPPDAKIVGTVMRNQKRKLFPDLFIAFREYLEQCERAGRTDLVKNTYLYCHTSYPDVGWRIPQLLKENNISHKVFFTYVCKQCGKFCCTKFQDVRTICKHCGSPSAVFPSTNQGLSEEELASVYQCFDLYIQYANCEGSGMGCQEATSCGVPLAAVNYSAMADTVRITEGIPLPPLKLIRELDVNADRATPDNTDCADKLYSFFTQPLAMRKRMGQKARQKTEEYFNWDRIAKIWADHFDSIEPTGVQGKWDEPPTLYNLPQTMPPGHDKVSNREFVQWLATHVLHDKDEIYTYRGMKMLQELNWGARRMGNQMVPLTREQLFQQLLGHMTNKNQYERARCGQVQLTIDDFVEYAKMKKQIYGEGQISEKIN